MKTVVFFLSPLVPVFWPSIGFVGTVLIATACTNVPQLSGRAKQSPFALYVAISNNTHLACGCCCGHGDRLPELAVGGEEDAEVVDACNSRRADPVNNTLNLSTTVSPTGCGLNLSTFERGKGITARPLEG